MSLIITDIKEIEKFKPEPTIEDLKNQWEALLQAQMRGEPTELMFAALRNSRERRVTWFGRREMDFRTMIDYFLSHETTTPEEPK